MSVTVADVTGDRESITVYQHSVGPVVFTALDGNGDAIDLSAKTVRFNAYVIGTPTASWSRETGGSGIVISGRNSNIVTVTLKIAGGTATAGNFTYDLWNVTDDELLKQGPMVIKKAVKDAAV